MLFRVFVEADGDVGGVGMLHGMRAAPIRSHEILKDEKRDEGKTIERDDECFVGARWTEIFPERFLSSHVLRLPVYGEREGVGD